MCYKIVLFTLFLGLFSLLIVLFESPRVVKVLNDRNMFLENQFQMYDDWAKQPLRQKYKFYVFNITNGDRFLWSDAPMTVDEIGPFVYDSLDCDETIGPDGYNVSSLSLKDVRFNLNESDGDESLFVYALNVPLIRNLSSEPHSLSKLPREDLVRKATVRDVLKDIVDGNGHVGTSLVEPSFPVNEVSKELNQDASSNYLQSLRKEICWRLFRVVRFVNPPTASKSGRFFRKMPCDCLAVTPNGTEGMGRGDPKYADVRTSKYLVLWDDERCARISGDPSLLIRPGRYVSENLFSVSSAERWRNESYVRFRPANESLNETRIKVERFSDVVTDFSLDFQLNIPIRFRGVRVNNYPVLRTVVIGVSKGNVDSSVYRFIVYPKKEGEAYESNIIYCVSFLSVSFLAYLFLWTWRRIRARMAREPDISSAGPYI